MGFTSAGSLDLFFSCRLSCVHNETSPIDRRPPPQVSLSHHKFLFKHQVVLAIGDLGGKMQTHGLFVFLATTLLMIILLQAEESKAWPIGEDVTLRSKAIGGSRLTMNVKEDESYLLSHHIINSTLQSRMMPTIPTSPSRIIMRAMRFHSFDLLTPIASAALALEDFYSQLAIKASTVWSTEPEQPAFSFRMGAFKLSFRCQGDTIPWHFVKEFAEIMWELACHQCTEVFEIIYTDQLQRIFVTIWLEIVERSPSPDECHFECPNPT